MQSRHATALYHSSYEQIRNEHAARASLQVVDKLVVRLTKSEPPYTVSTHEQQNKQRSLERLLVNEPIKQVEEAKWLEERGHVASTPHRRPREVVWGLVPGVGQMVMVDHEFAV